MTGPRARDPQPGDPEYRQRWGDAAPGDGEYAEALRWFRQCPWTWWDGGRMSENASRHAATIVRAALAGARPAPAEPDAPTPMDPRDMHGLAISEGVDAGNWYPYCPACSWNAGEQVGKCTEPVVAAQWPDTNVFVPRAAQPGPDAEQAGGGLR